MRSFVLICLFISPMAMGFRVLSQEQAQDLRPDPVYKNDDDDFARAEKEVEAAVEFSDVETEAFEGRSMDDMFEDADKEAFVELFNGLLWDADLEEDVETVEGEGGEARQMIRRIR